MLRRLVLVLHWIGFSWSCVIWASLISAGIAELYPPFGPIASTGKDIVEDLVLDHVGDFKTAFVFLGLGGLVIWPLVRYVLLGQWVWFPWHKMK